MPPSMTRNRITKLPEILRRHPADHSSLRAQIARVSVLIFELTEHIRQHPGDLIAKRGLLRRLSERRKLLERLAKHSPKEYEEVVSIILVAAGVRDER
jgi:small subunit ribosomal protein S15